MVEVGFLPPLCGLAAIQFGHPIRRRAERSRARIVMVLLNAWRDSLYVSPGPRDLKLLHSLHALGNSKVEIIAANTQDLIGVLSGLGVASGVVNPAQGYRDANQIHFGL